MAERSSRLSSLLFGSPSNAGQLRSLASKWIGIIANNAGSGIRRRDFEERLSSIAFITFNYDRTLEWYLAHYISTSFAVRWEEAVTYVREMPIYHVYGSLGDPFNRDYFEFGAAGQFAIYAAKNILTFCEEINSVHAKRISEILLNCRRSVFLGCAFHRQNMQILYPHGIHHDPAVWATSLGMRLKESDAINSFFGYNRVNLKNATCSELLNEQWDEFL